MKEPCSDNVKRDIIIDHFLKTFDQSDLKTHEMMNNVKDNIIKTLHAEGYNDISVNRPIQIEERKVLITTLLIEKKFPFDTDQMEVILGLKIFDRLWFHNKYDIKTNSVVNKHIRCTIDYIEQWYDKFDVNNIMVGDYCLEGSLEPKENQSLSESAHLMMRKNNFENLINGGSLFDIHFPAHGLHKNLFLKDLIISKLRKFLHKEEGIKKEGREGTDLYGKTIELLSNSSGLFGTSNHFLQVIDNRSLSSYYVLFDMNEGKMLDKFDYMESNPDGSLTTYCFDYPSESHISFLDKKIKNTVGVSNGFTIVDVSNAISDVNIPYEPDEERFYCVVKHILSMMIVHMYLGENTGSQPEKVVEYIDNNEADKYEVLSRLDISKYLKKILLRGGFSNWHVYAKKKNKQIDFGLSDESSLYNTLLSQTLKESFTSCCIFLAGALNNECNNDGHFCQNLEQYGHDLLVGNNVLQGEDKVFLFKTIAKIFGKLYLYNRVETTHQFNCDMTKLNEKSSSNGHIDPPKFNRLFSEIITLKGTLIQNIKFSLQNNKHGILARYLSEYFKVFDDNDDAILQIDIDGEVWYISCEGGEEIDGIQGDQTNNNLQDDMFEDDVLDGTGNSINRYVEDNILEIEGFILHKKISSTGARLRDRYLFHFPELNTDTDGYLMGKHGESIIDESSHVFFRMYDYESVPIEAIKGHLTDLINLLSRHTYYNGLEGYISKEENFDQNQLDYVFIFEKAIQRYLLECVYKKSLGKNQGNQKNRNTIMSKKEINFYNDEILAQALVDTMWKVYDTQDELFSLMKSSLFLKKMYKDSPYIIRESTTSHNYLDFLGVNTFLEYVVRDTAKKAYSQSLQLIMYGDHYYQTNEEMLRDIAGILVSELEKKMIVKDMNITTRTVYLNDIIINE